MSSAEALQAYEDLTFQMRRYDGVAVRPDGLYVYGRQFAFLDEEDLVVQLSPARSRDLEERGQVRVSRGGVGVSDRELWTELARDCRRRSANKRDYHSVAVWSGLARGVLLRGAIRVVEYVRVVGRLVSLVVDHHPSLRVQNGRQ